MSSTFNCYPIWHLIILYRATVCGILCMWVALFWLFQASMYMLFVVFSFCYTLNHQFKGGGGDCWNNIYFHLEKYHIFWIHFEFSCSDGKLVKFCIEPQIWKIIAKFSVPLLSHDHTPQPKSHTFEHISFELNSQNYGTKMQATVFTSSGNVQWAFAFCST